MSIHLQTAQMLAVLCARYGGPEAVSVGELPMPVPGPDEIRVKVMASPITVGDRRIRSLDFPQGMQTLGRLAMGWRRPRNPVLGAVFAGRVDAVGENVARWQVGDAVFGMDGRRMGCHAAFKIVGQAGAIARIPADLSFEGAAALPFGALTAMHFLRCASLQRGEHLLVNGAAGACGAMALQVATANGTHVTAVCSGRKQAWAKRLGAMNVIDYATTDLTQGSDRFDVILDAVGNHAVKDMLRVLKPGGRLIRLTAGLGELWLANRPHLRRPERRVIAGLSDERAEDLNELAMLVEHKQIRPYIDSVFSCYDAAMAHARADASGLDGAVLLQFD
jgi:NADPH:quinone reductase-like Zn-dependent oxidoreductase